MAKLVLVLAFVWSARAARVHRAHDQIAGSAQGTEIVSGGISDMNQSAALVDAISENYCANFQYDHIYAKCSAFTESSRLTEAYCNTPISSTEIVGALKHEKCIKCSQREVEQVCKEVEKPCSGKEMDQLEDKDAVCQAIVFGYSTKAHKVDVSDLKSDALRGVTCNLHMLERYCEETWLPSARLCSALTTDEVDIVCTRFLTRDGSAKTAAALTGGVFGARCETADVRKMCNKQSCADFTDDEFHQFCDARVEAGVTAAEASLYAQEHEALNCSKETILSTCPKPCNVDAEDEDAVCNLVTFGYSKKGRPFDSTLSEVLRRMKIHCTSKQMNLVCKERSHPACDTIPDVNKKAVCELLRDKGVDDLPGKLGGVFGVACTAASVREMCGKSQCESLDDADWEVLCEAKAEHGLTRAEFAERLKNHEHLECSTPEIKAHCQNTCKMEDKVSKRLCPLLLSGYSSRGPVEWTDQLWRRQGVRCAMAAAKEACADTFQFETCDLDDEQKEQVCDLRKRGKSEQEISGTIQGALAMACSPEDIARMCTNGQA